MGQAADHPAGAAVQVTGLGDKASRFVSMQTQGTFHGGDELSPLLGVGECAGVDHPATAGQLPSPRAGEQPRAFHFDPGVNECRRQMLGEVFEVVGQFFAGAGVEVEVVDFIDHHDVGTGIDEHLAHGIGNIGHVHPLIERGKPQKPCELHRQLAGRGS